MARISPKDNFLKLAGGGHPEYVPFYTFAGTEGTKEHPTKRASPMIWASGGQRTQLGDGRSVSDWGVTYIETKETANTAMPEPGVFPLEDITKWRDTLKVPALRDDIDTLDWDAMAKADIERAGIDRNETCVLTGLSSGSFMQLVTLMGFTGALVAMSEEPEYVKELLDHICSITEPYIEKTLDAYKPDIWALGDDTATERIPFFSVEMYRDILLPIYRRQAKLAQERGIPIIFHICGNHEPFLDDMLDFGVKYTEPAQETMDILALKEKYKGRLSFLGCYDWGKHCPPNYPQYDEEAVRQDVRYAYDKYSPGGAYGMLAWPISYLGDPAIEGLKKIIWDECESYGKKIYGYID